MRRRNRSGHAVSASFYLGECALEAIETTLEVEGFVFCPHSTKDLQVFVGAGIALIVAQVVAIATLLVVTAARNKVDREAAA
jgi:hypothetical protein